MPNLMTSGGLAKALWKFYEDIVEAKNDEVAKAIHAELHNRILNSHEKLRDEFELLKSAGSAAHEVLTDVESALGQSDDYGDLLVRIRRAKYNLSKMGAHP